ncbi:MAG: neutral/alkaline non-lysosomal ceramidase N-terminal domain-containing protein [Bacteroidia bacterium]
MKAGIAKVKVRFKRKEYPLQGYGSMDNISSGFENDLHARAFIFKSDTSVFAIIHLECAFITHHLKEKVVQSFNLSAPAAGLNIHNVLFCANTTRSAPGGYSHYPLFNITSRGFLPEVFNAYIAASSEALQKAWFDLEDSKLRLNASYFDLDQDVGFNRSLDAFNLNSDVEAQSENNTHLAINRLVRQIIICRSNDNAKGLLNWFGVQGISIPQGSGKVHPDNKGFAASLLENDKSEDKDFIAGFCVEAAGDVSPNYHGTLKRWPRGRYEDHFKSAYFNGFIQFEKSRNMMEDEDLQIPMSQNLDVVHSFVDFSQVYCDKKYTFNNEEQQTAEAIAGIGFAEGDDIDNPGIDAFSAMILKNFLQVKRFFNHIRLFNSRRKRVRRRHLEEAHHPKLPMLELQDKLILGFSDLSKVPLPYMPSEITAEFRKQYRNGALREHSWAPVILPIQIARLADVAILGFPGEITTAAGIRLRKTVLEILEPLGIIDVVITSCSNEYGGYVSTYEEYQLQLFEGASTLFGAHTLSAFQTEFAKLAKELLKPSSDRRIPYAPQPPEFSQTELDLRTVPYK